MRIPSTRSNKSFHSMNSKFFRPTCRRCSVTEMIAVVLLAAAVVVDAWIGVLPPQITTTTQPIALRTSIPPRSMVITSRKIKSRTSTILFSARDDKDASPIENTGPKNDGTPRNEFSRTIRVSKWFSAASSSSSGGGGSLSNNRSSSSRRVMELSISASPEERQALATRFRLTKITSLSADVIVQPALGGGTNAFESGYNGECIEARGTVCAHVTQTCVRTNEEFDVNLEFNFDTVLRAMSTTSNSASDNSSSREDIAALAASKLGEGKSSRSNRGGKGQRGGGVKGVRGGGQTSSKDLGDKKMKELQDIFMEYEVTDEIIEDESCFCTDGIVDCGEIVAQMFRSKLDPYPKKPGSVSFHHHMYESSCITSSSPLNDQPYSSLFDHLRTQLLTLSLFE